jgi:trigger factor
MHVSVEEISSVKKVLHIEIPETSVKERMDDAYRSLKQNTKLKGFRPGKVPRSVLERMFQKDVNQEVFGKLIEETFTDAIRNQAINMIGSPQIDAPELDSDNGVYRYSATVEIIPEIPDIDYKGLTLKKTVYPVTDEEIENQLAALQKRLTDARTLETERPVEGGDLVLIDLETFQNGQPFEPIGRMENHTQKVGDGSVDPAFDAGLIGMRPGESREIPVRFPDDHSNADLKGREITFQVTLRELREEVLLPIDDDFAKRVGPFENLAALRQAIKAELRQGYDKRTEQELHEQIFNTLLDQVSFEVPEAMIEAEIDSIVEETRQKFEYHNTTLEEQGITRERIAKDYGAVAEAQARRFLLLTRIIEQDGLSVTPEEESQGMAMVAKNTGQSVETVRTYFAEDAEKKNHFHHTLLAKRVLGIILEHSQIEETTATPESPEPAENAG